MGTTTKKAFPKEVEDIKGAHRIIGMPKGGRKYRVIHTQGNEICLIGKMYWYERDFPGAKFMTLDPGQSIPKTN